METVLIVIHLVIVVIMAGVILLQRSEGGALGIGGGGGSGGFMSSRGSGNVMTRITAILATLFFLTSITLTILGNYGGSSILDRIPGGSDDGTIQPLAPISTPSESSSTAPAPQVPATNAEGPQVPTGN